MSPSKRSLSANPDRLGAWLWGTIATIALVAVMALIVASRDDGQPTESHPFVNPVAVASRLGAYGTPDGEGLTRSDLTAVTGRTNTTDGGNLVPQATVDGPGRRVFAGITVRLAKGRQPFVLRQVTPNDLPARDDALAFVRWEGWVAVLTPEQIRAGRSASGLAWRKASSGIAVPAGATVRLRTLFRIPQSAGRCVGASSADGVSGYRAQEALRGAPAWMVRRPGRNATWQWLRADTQDVSGLPVAVRSGPTRPVLFRSSNVCQMPQTSVTVDPDPEQLGIAGAGKNVPLDTPSGY